MIGGLLLVGWIIWRARHEEFSPAFYTPVIVVGLYWSFVDIVWIVLYPLIYLVGRGLMTPRFRRLWLTLALLLILLAIEFGASFLPMERSVRPLLLIPAVLMVGTVGTMFMDVGRGPEIVRLFADSGPALAHDPAWLGQPGSNDSNRLPRSKYISEIDVRPPRWSLGGRGERC